MLVLGWSRCLRLHFLDDASSLAERDVGVAADSEADSEAQVEVPAAGGAAASAAAPDVARGLGGGLLVVCVLVIRQLGQQLLSHWHR